MNDKWADKEFISSDLGDKRLTKRLIQIADKLSSTPEAPINQACENWGETKAAYRFFQNEKINYKDILKSHVGNTVRRCNEHDVILAVQDSTYLTYSHHSQTTGLCPLNRSKGKNKKELVTLGLVMHSTLALTVEGLPIGILEQKIYSREALTEEKKKLQKKTYNNGLKIEEKDSIKWLESVRNSHELFANSRAKVVTIGDRESDIYELFQMSSELDENILVRANQNRIVNKRSSHLNETGEKLWDLMNATGSSGEIEIKLPVKESRPSRIATCEVRINEFTVTAPRGYRSEKKTKPPLLDFYAIYVKEKDTPEGVEEIEWMLITNIKCKSFEDGAEKIKWYCLRWRIEVWHKILKSGLKIEDCRLATANRLIRYLSVMSIIGWRIFWITLIARNIPDESCMFWLNETEWKVLYKKFNSNKKLPDKCPTMKEVVIWIAKLGGFLARRGDKDPGITHVWRGLKKFANILEGVEIAKNICG